MASVQLTALPGGPYRLKGDVKILDRDGQPLPERGFCDGSRARTVWKEDA